jgi:putative transposase
MLANGMRQQVLEHIVSQASVKDIEIHLINCWIDHVHCLIRLKSGQNVAGTIEQIRGESVRWINRNKLSEKRFAWSKDYFAASVSEGNLLPVQNYILGQERHHEHRTYQQEVEAYFIPASE